MLSHHSGDRQRTFRYQTQIFWKVTFPCHEWDTNQFSLKGQVCAGHCHYEQGPGLWQVMLCPKISLTDSLLVLNQLPGPLLLCSLDMTTQTSLSTCDDNRHIFLARLCASDSRLTSSGPYSAGGPFVCFTSTQEASWTHPPYLPSGGTQVITPHCLT